MGSHVVVRPLPEDTMRSRFTRSLAALLGLAATSLAILGSLSSVVPAAEPYPFKTRPRDPVKETLVDIDFEGALPSGAELGPKAKIEDKAGTGGTKGLVSSGKGVILKVPVAKTKIDISRFDLSVDYAGPGFSLFTAKINAYNLQGKLLQSVNIGSEWGIHAGLHTWELRKADLEFPDIHTVSLEIEQTNEEGTVKLDNIRLRRYDLPSMFGKTARKELTGILKREGLKVDDVGDVWIGSAGERQSFFDFTRIDENKRYVASDWQERLHVGTTFKSTRGKLPTFMLGVNAREAALQAAAARTGKTLADMHVMLLDDVKAHGFNLVWCDFTTDLEKFDELAAARGISLIIRDPNWSGLGAWVAKPDGPMPDAFKTTAKANIERIAKLKSVVGYQVAWPLNTAHQKMLAEARAYLASVAPKVQLVSHDSDVFAAENMQEPYANVGIQWGLFQQYAGRPWIPPSYLYHPNYWPVGLAEGWFRRIHNGYQVRSIPNLWAIPSGRAFSKNTLGMQADQVKVDVSGWTLDEKTKRWSGWQYYDFPPNLLKCALWSAVEAGAAGVIVDEWGPSEIATTVTGPEILKDEKYKEGVYRHETLRQFDLSESDGWKELAAGARELSGLKQMLTEATLHGQNNVRTNNGNVHVRTLTGRDDIFKVLTVVNRKLGDYDEAKLKVNPVDGKLENYTAASSLRCDLTIEKDFGLIDMQTGKALTPKSTNAKDKSAVYEVDIGPGEARLFYRGKIPAYRTFLTKYKVTVGGTSTADAGADAKK